MSRSTIVLILLLTVGHAPRARAADATQADLERRFAGTVRPFVENYCLNCHGKDKPKADFDLSPYSSMAAVMRDHLHWELALEKLESGDMPPAKAKQQPSPEQRQEVIAWLKAARQHEAQKHAGDPGPVLARRLSNAEYDYTIRDLTGVNLRPTREFPVDPANQAGFDNSGESLAMSPALFKKYLQAAREVAEHLVLKPDGLAFAPHGMMTDTDRDKYCVMRIVDFYQRQPTDYADYFYAAWRFQHRAGLRKPKATLAETAADVAVSPKYLAMIWEALNDPQEAVGPLAKLQAMWRQIPSLKGNQTDAARRGCEEMRDFVVRLRSKLVPYVANLKSPGVHDGSQCFVLWKDRQWAANRRRYDVEALQVAGAELRKDPSGKTVSADSDLAVPADPGARARYEAAFARFSALFPDAFYISERARVYLDPEKEKKLGGRLLSAGFHSMTGFFRDDGPLYELLLDADRQRELDRLWNEFDFIASVPQRMHSSFLWFERTDSRFMTDEEFDFARAEDKDAGSEAKVRQLAEVYGAKAERNGGGPVALAAIREHFERVSENIRRVDQAHQSSERVHLAAVQDFAARAYRRPLAPGEIADLAAFYRTAREQDGFPHEEAIRDTLVSVLMSPHFCYRIDLADGASGTRNAAAADSGSRRATRPLSDYALASRLSYFLWASLPDDELLAKAAAGELHRPEVLTAQARRMLQDPRVRGLVTEFGANWLDFRRFEELNSVDRERFPEFDNELRQAMFEEPVRFFLDVIQRQGSALEFLYARHTFINAPLARHYGMPDPKTGAAGWVRFDEADKYGRGGLLPMAAFLTKNSPGLRTSPVKRGYWVVRQVLGEHIPPPPAVVPELPNDESKLGELTLRETLARHREDKSCASCHARFDSFGLVFEGYGPVGERREKDLGGKPVDTRAVFPGGTEGAGLTGLREYVRLHRQEDFLDNLCRKMLAYGLGRTVMLSDDATIQAMRRKLAANGYRFDSIVESIVTSPQFLNQRVPDNLASK
jgi:mono/diheme cytochrome c family protein